MLRNADRAQTQHRSLTRLRSRLLTQCHPMWAGILCMRPTTCPACSIALTPAGTAFLAHAAGDLYCPEDSKVLISDSSRLEGGK